MMYNHKIHAIKYPSYNYCIAMDDLRHARMTEDEIHIPLIIIEKYAVK